MKVKNANLKWLVLMCDFNSKEIRGYNVFNKAFVEELHKKVLKKKVTNKEQLKNFIDSFFMYHYWSKSEFEILVGGLFVKDEKDLTKIDIYTQLKMNLDLIVEYVNQELKLNFK